MPTMPDAVNSPMTKYDHVIENMELSSYGNMLPLLGLGLRLLGEIGRAHGLHLLGLGDQRRVELHEGGVHRGVLLVTDVAVRGLRQRLGGAGAVQGEEGPAALEARGVLDVGLDAQAVGLEMALLVDRAVLH